MVLYLLFVVGILFTTFMLLIKSVSRNIEQIEVQLLNHIEQITCVLEVMTNVIEQIDVELEHKRHISKKVN